MVKNQHDSSGLYKKVNRQELIKVITRNAPDALLRVFDKFGIPKHVAWSI